VDGNGDVDGAQARTYWSRWHDDYDDPTSPLSWRLGVVRDRIRVALAEHPGPARILSLCAGQGRDVIGALAEPPRRDGVRALLVDNDASNCAYAEAAAAEHGLTGVAVRCADAAVLGASADGVPADVLLLCGIFGNIDDPDIERTVRNCSRVCAPGATVLWTRHRKPPDRTVDIRRWFDASGFEAVGFDTIDGDGSYAAVGAQRLVGEPLPYDPDLRLFTFVR